MSRNKKVLFSHQSDEYITPESLFDYLNKPYRFGYFTLDPASTDQNAKCKKHFTKNDNGLVKSWTDEIVFVNPPYSENSKWVKKAFEESKNNGAKVTMLLPARTDTKWFHDYCMKAKEIYFIRGRLRFNNTTNSAPFPSMIVFFNETFDEVVKPPTIYTLEQEWK